jgi:2-oxoisovalerate ferredoxin oxidoreductase beta subunit
VNNAIYSMTGGQAAPTTLLGQKSATTPLGRKRGERRLSAAHERAAGSTLEAPVYIERVGLGDNKQIAQATRAIKRAVENQVRGLGFSLIEVLAPCPTIFKMTPVEAQHWVRDVMEKTFPLGVIRDRTKEAQPRQLAVRPRRRWIGFRKFLAWPTRACRKAIRSLDKTAPEPLDLRVRVAGFGGQGVLLLGEVLAEAGLDAGLEVSWLPSYGPEMRSGTSNCHVRLSRHVIDSPLVTQPNVLVAMNEPSLRKFVRRVCRREDGFSTTAIQYPDDCVQENVHVLARPFTQSPMSWAIHARGQHGDAGRAAGDYRRLQEVNIDAALRRLVKNPRWTELNKRALYKESCQEMCHAG